jgi:kumamolisin
VTTEPVDPDERVEVSVLLRPRRSLDVLSRRIERPLTREEFAATYGADAPDVASLEAFAHEHNLHVEEVSLARRTVRLVGRAADVAAAFGVSLERLRQPDGAEYRTARGAVQLPADLADRVEGVFGLDTRPVAWRRE